MLLKDNLMTLKWGLSVGQLDAQTSFRLKQTTLQYQLKQQRRSNLTVMEPTCILLRLSSWAN